MHFGDKLMINSKSEKHSGNLEVSNDFESLKEWKIYDENTKMFIEQKNCDVIIFCNVS